jgi:hypothetical protein
VKGRAERRFNSLLNPPVEVTEVVSPAFFFSLCSLTKLNPLTLTAWVLTLVLHFIFHPAIFPSISSTRARTRPVSIGVFPGGERTPPSVRGPRALASVQLLTIHRAPGGERGSVPIKNISLPQPGHKTG